MMEVFKSKQSRGLILFLSIFLGGEALLMLHVKSIGGFLIVLGVMVFFIYMFLNTFYRIEGMTLHIKCGLLFRQVVAIDKIRRISETNTLISSPATSLDRLEIRFEDGKKFGTVVISPKDKVGFIRKLLELNPEIEVKYHSKKHLNE